MTHRWSTNIASLRTSAWATAATSSAVCSCQDHCRHLWFKALALCPSQRFATSNNHWMTKHAPPAAAWGFMTVYFTAKNGHLWISSPWCRCFHQKNETTAPGTPNITKFFQFSLSRHSLVDEFLSSITITWSIYTYKFISYINMLQYSLISVAHFLHHGTGDRDGLLKLGRRVAPHSQLQHGLGGEMAFLSNASGITMGILWEIIWDWNSLNHLPIQYIYIYIYITGCNNQLSVPILNSHLII